MFLTCVLHPLVLFQALKDEVESYRNQAQAAEKKLHLSELEAHEQVPGAVASPPPRPLPLGKEGRCLKIISCFKAKAHIFLQNFQLAFFSGFFFLVIKEN